MVSVGIDAGTKSYGIFIFEEGKSYEIDSEVVRSNPEEFIHFLEEIDFEIAAGLSGYGLPVKELSEVDDKDLFYMTLNLDRDSSIGLRKVIKLIKDRKLKIYTIPGVIHLQTVPEHRKINRIDMGTYDKVCSVALSLYRYGLDESFILAELGYGFNAFIAVDRGRIVDGIGGSSGFLGYSSISAIDGELACLLDVTKKTIFSGGLKSYFSDKGEVFNAEIFAEWVLKGIHALRAVVKTDRVILSGRFARDVLKYVKRDFDAEILKSRGKASAEGASIIANGLAGGECREIIERLDLLNARGTIFDYLTMDIKKSIRLNNLS
uniref:DUF1464 domain-containing protein n=1 Tax=Geoglobus ahangari TaxID=113653 RepID=A0A7C3YPW8_9EURY